MRRRRPTLPLLLVACIALFVCKGSDNAKVASPQPSKPEYPELPNDEFHQLLSKGAVAGQQSKVRAQVLANAVERSNAASFALWQAFEAQGNFVVSPYSIRAALGLAYLASLPGEGRSSLCEAMSFPERNDDLDIRLLDDAVLTSSDATFESISSVWVARHETVRPTYVDAVSRILPAEVHAIDFAANPEHAREMINIWVSERTRGKIPHILHSGDIINSTRATLVNAVYFHGKWHDPFEPERTVLKPFQTAEGTTIQTKMMMDARGYGVFRDDYQAAVKWYEGASTLTFVVVMPKQWESFRWDAARFQRVWADLNVSQGVLTVSQEVLLEMPKFNIRAREELDDAFSALGLRLDDPQLLQGLLSSSETISIGRAIHEAFIRVDETSTEAAAATALTVTPIMAMPSSPIFRVDRPFYFLLVEAKTGLITFMGQVTDPSMAED